ncbi:hypothetical protein JOM56_008998 [Amanita muscaria]
MDQSNDNESQPLLQPRNTDRQFLASVSGFVHQLCDCINIRPQMRFNGPLSPPSTPPFSGSFPSGRYGVVGSTYNTSASRTREELDLSEAPAPPSQRLEEPATLPSALGVSEQVITSARQARKGFGKHAAFRDRSEGPAPSHNISHNERSHTPVLSESTTTALFQGAYGFSISGNPNFTNIGNINNYGGSHGLEHMEKFVSFNAFHNSAVQDPDRKCHPGTRVVVLNRIRNWFNDTTLAERACWLHGPAGAGKSAIAQTIAHSCSQGQVAATFFFYRSDASRNDGNCLFTTIAWQLAFLIPGIKDHIARALDRRPDLPRMDVETQFEEFIVRPFQALEDVSFSTHLRSLVVIIDGVDECTDEKLQRRFLKLIGNAIKDNHFPLRFFICSRPEAHIQETIDRFPKPNLQIDLASLDDANHDIEKFLKDEFSRIASDQGLDSTGWPGHEKIQQVVYKSSGQFVYASIVIRYVSDEYNSAVMQLDIVLGLKPQSSGSPFAELDALFMEILERQSDRPFLITFLAVLIARLSITPPKPFLLGDGDFHLDDAMLMNVSEFELHRKLRGMHSLFKFKPHIDLHHRSFLDFLQDPSRSCQFYTSRENAQRRYLDLVTDSVVRFAEKTIYQPNHETGHFCPQFCKIALVHPRRVNLPVTEWQEALKPLLCLQDKLLTLPNFTSTWNLLPCDTCTVFQIMRDFLSHLTIMQGTCHPVTSNQLVELYLNESDVNRSNERLIEAGQNVHEDDLVGCVYSLLSQLRKAKLEPSVNTTTINLICSLLCFDYAEIAKRVNSIADAQVLMDFIDSLTNDDYFLNKCGPDTACKLVRLAMEIYARVPVLPRSVFSNTDICPGRNWRGWGDKNLEIRCQTALLRRILDHNYVVPLLRIYETDDDMWFVGSIASESKSLKEWRETSKPSSVERIRAMLEVAKAIRYLHAIGIVFDYTIGLVCITADFGKIYQGDMLSG